MAKESISVPFFDIFKQAFSVMTGNMFLSIGGAAILSYVPTVVIVLPFCLVGAIVAGGTGMLTKGNNFAAMVAVLPIALVGMVIFAAGFNLIRVGWTRITLKLNRGEQATFGDFAESIPWFVNFFLTCFLIGIATALGSLLIIPGIFIAIRTVFAPYLVVEHNLGPIQAIIRSNELVSGYSWQIFGFQILLMAVNSLAWNTPIIQFVAIPAVMAYFDLVLARMYLLRAGELNLDIS